MSRRTRRSPVSWNGSGNVLQLEPEPSRLLAAWWLGVHALASLGIAASALPLVIKIVAVAVALAHARLRRPSPPRSLVQYSDGRWTQPEGAALGLARGASAGPFWVVLRFGHGRSAASVLLLRDQLPASEWRALQAAVRRAKI